MYPKYFYDAAGSELFELITDQPEKTALLAALEAGVTSFLAGTFTPQRLRDQITSVLQMA